MTKNERLANIYSAPAPIVIAYLVAWWIGSDAALFTATLITIVVVIWQAWNIRQLRKES